MNDKDRKALIKHLYASKKVLDRLSGDSDNKVYEGFELMYRVLNDFQATVDRYDPVESDFLIDELLKRLKMFSLKPYV